MSALKPNDGFQLFSTPDNLLNGLTRAKESLIICGNFQYLYTRADPMANTWNSLLGDAKTRKRFFDLNGTFDEAEILRLLS